MVTDESKDGVALFSFGNILLDAAHGVKHRSVALIDVAVALGYVVDNGLGKFSFPQDESVHTVVSQRVVRHHYIGRHMAVDTSAAFYKHPLPYLATLVYKSVGRKYGEVADLAVTGYLH